MEHTGAIENRICQTLLSELTPFTNYSIQIAAVNEEGDIGVFSYPIMIQTGEDGKKF